MRLLVLLVIFAVCSALADEAWEQESESAVESDKTHEELTIADEAVKAAPELVRKLDNIELTGPNQVIEVTDETVGTEVMALKRAVILLFYDAGSTDEVERQYEYAARVLHDEVRLCKINGEPNFQTRVNHQIQFYPQIRMFSRNKDHGSHPYYGAMDNATLVTAFRAFADEVDRDIVLHAQHVADYERAKAQADL